MSKMDKVKTGKVVQKFHLVTTDGVFPKWNGSFIEFSEFRESGKSLEQELGSI